MIVKIDVDGVLRNLVLQMCVEYNKLTGENMKPKDCKNYDVDISFPLIKKYANMKPREYFFKEHCNEMFLEAPPFKGIKEGIKILKKAGCYISIVTKQTGLDAKISTLLWLEKNGIKYDDIHFTGDKENVYGDIMIDDSCENLEKEHPNVVSYCIATAYNTDWIGSRFKSFKECAEHIARIICK